jgi:hypothetical protein
VSWTAVRLMFVPWRCGARLTGQQKAALSAVLTHASQGDHTAHHAAVAARGGHWPESVGVCVLSASQLADEAGCAERTMRVRLVELEGLRLIQRVDRGPGRAPGWVVDDYQILALLAREKPQAARVTPDPPAGDPGSSCRGPRILLPGAPDPVYGVASDSPEPPAGGPRILLPGDPGSSCRGVDFIPRARDCPIALLPDPPSVPPPAVGAESDPEALASPAFRPARLVASAARVAWPSAPARGEDDSWSSATSRALRHRAQRLAEKLAFLALAARQELGGRGPVQSALGQLADDLEAVQGDWQALGQPDPGDLLVVLDEAWPAVEAAVAAQAGLDDPPPSWAPISPTLDRVRRCAIEARQDLQEHAA